MRWSVDLCLSYHPDAVYIVSIAKSYIEMTVQSDDTQLDSSPDLCRYASDPLFSLLSPSITIANVHRRAVVYQP